MDVAVVGATGDVGRQVLTQLVERRVVPPSSRLQLVGRAGGPSERAVAGLRADLVDAYDEVAPLLDAAASPDDVVADVVVLCGGLTVPADGSVTREQLAEANAALFRDYADALARHGSGHEVVVVVTNPVELGVAVVAERLGRHRVVGMGAWLDTLRFRREVAVGLGVRRSQVGGFVVGQHGADVVPLWSTVRVVGLDADERARAVADLRGPRTLDDWTAEVADAQARLLPLARGDDVPGALRLVDAWPPDLRAALRPWVTQLSGAKTAVGTAAATVDLVATLLGGRETVVAGQVALAGEVLGLHGVLGVPLVVGGSGWRRVVLDPLPEDEERRLREVAARVDASVRPHLGAA